ncbi:sialate O-acetylesterase, partial [Escherichia coli]|nr:sialate O-acetylesterase [Escherichia coli]EEW4411357.1 sialate O-acetylesterase [Escherichia coli]
PSGDGGAVISTTSEPEYYFVIALAGQSNSMSFGEGLPLPDTYDRPDPRIKQLARRSTVTPGGAACAYNDIIPADHCLHDVQDVSNLNHPKADLNKGQYGCVGHALHVAKKLLPFMPARAGILLVPCGRGDSGFTAGAEGAFNEASGATAGSSLWGVDKPLYRDLVSRTRAALKKNPKNVLLSVIWMQGEKDVSSGRHAEHNALFLAMVNKYRADLADIADQCIGGTTSGVPWICGDTTYDWKAKYAVQYEAVYGGYKGKAAQNIHFVPLMTDEHGANVPTNEPSEDPDIITAGYYGAASRSNGNWTTADRKTHFSSWARRGIVSDRLAGAILQYAGRTLSFLTGQSAPQSGGTTPVSPGTPGVEKPQDGGVAGAGHDEAVSSTRTVAEYDANSGNGVWTEQQWGAAGGKGTVTDDGGRKALRLEKQPGKLTSWKMFRTVAVEEAKNLLSKGGEIAVRFKIPDGSELVNGQFVFGLYWPVSQWASGAAANSMLASFFLQTDASNLNLMHHKGTSNAQLGTFGAFDHNWHTVVFRFAGNNSERVVPVIDGTEQTAFDLVMWTNDGFTADTLTLTDITGAKATYPVLLDTVTVKVNESRASS